MSFSPTANSKTLYRTLLIESDAVSDDSLSSVLVHARFLVERCATPVEAVNLFRDHDLVLIRASAGMPTENLRHLVSWLRHNSIEGAEPIVMIVAGKTILRQLDGLPCDLVDERSGGSMLTKHLMEVRGYLDTSRKHSDSSFWARLFGRSQPPEEHADPQASPFVAHNPAHNSAPQKVAEIKTGQHMNSPKVEALPPAQVTAVGVQPVAPLVPRDKVAGLKAVPREVMPIRRPLEISSIAPILLKEISEAAVVLGHDYRVIEANDAWLSVFASEKGAVLGSAGVEFKTGFDKVAWANILHRALLGRDFDADQEVLEPPLQSLKVRPVPGNDGTPMGVLILCTSMSASDLKWSQSGEPEDQVEVCVRADLETDIERQKVRIHDLSDELTALRQRIDKAETEAKSAQNELVKERVAARAAQKKHELQRVRFDELVDALASARSISSESNRQTASLLAKVSAPKIDLSLLDYAPFGLVRLSPDGDVMFANTQVDKLMGYPITFGQSFTDWIAKGRPSDETSAALVDEWTDKVWRRQMTCVVQVAGDDGLLKDVEFRPAMMEDGGLLVFATDVTDRQQVYHALRSAEAKFRGMFRSTVAGVALMDRDAAIYDANVTFCEMFAQKRGDICSTTLPALVQRCTGDEDSVNVLENPTCLTLPNGQQVVLACPAPSSGENEAHAIFCVPVPVAETKQSAVDDSDAREGIQAMLALADEWRRLSLRQDENARSETLVRWFDVLSSVTVPDRQNELDIARVVRDIIAEIRLRMRDQARANILFDAPVDERFISRATAIPLALAISELLENAIQHGLKNGAIEGLVRVHFTCSEHEIVAEVCDTGAELRQSFEFERHAGEGLTLARLLAARVGGKLRIDSGAETRCQLNIPLT